MLKAAVAKIKSALSRLPARKSILIVLAVVCLTLPFVVYKPTKAVLHVGGTSYQLQIASTPVTRQLGLGGRSAIPKDAGMLFVFDKPAKQCMWMKDMRFPLDIIWLNGRKQVIYLRQNLAPASYPAIFCSATPSRYVIELNAGEAAKRHITLGQTLLF